VFFYKLAEGFKKKDPKNVLLVFTRIVRKNVYCLFFLFCLVLVMSIIKNLLEIRHQMKLIKVMNFFLKPTFVSVFLLPSKRVKKKLCHKIFEKPRKKQKFDNITFYLR
jgi:hypothetical protein